MKIFPEPIITPKTAFYFIEVSANDRIYTLKSSSYNTAVAPFTGVWIETQEQIRQRLAAQSVAPFTGVWIETIPKRMDVEM